MVAAGTVSVFDDKLNRSDIRRLYESFSTNLLHDPIKKGKKKERTKELQRDLSSIGH